MRDEDHISERLAAVRGRDVEFATMPDRPSDPPSLERRVVITAPPDLVELSRTGDVRVLDRLVELLGEPDTAWPAQVILSAMTRRDEKLVDAFAGAPDEWLSTAGRDAHARWREWLDQQRDHLVWDPGRRAFVQANGGAEDDDGAR